MKKYWKLFMLAIFTFLLVGIHYVQASHETSDYLTLSLKTTRGDESVVQNRTFYGTYYSRSSLYTPATVTQDGYTTPLKSLFLYGMFGKYMELEMDSLIEQNRSFMRGKIHDPMYYYEDEKRLLYVEFPNQGEYKSEQPLTFNISSLTKSEGIQLDYTATTLQSFPFQYVYVVEVQFVDEYIKVVAQVYGKGQNALYVFTIDETKRTVIEYKPLMTSETGEYYTVHQDYTDYAPKAYFLYGSSSDYVENTPDNSTTQGESIKDFKLYKFDLKTMETAPIDVPEAVRNNTSNSVATNDATHFVVYGENALALYSYHFDNNEWTNIELENSFEVALNEVFVVDDVLYITHGSMEKSLLDAYDLATGKQLYRGEVISKSDVPFYFRMTGVK